MQLSLPLSHSLSLSLSPFLLKERVARMCVMHMQAESVGSSFSQSVSIHDVILMCVCVFVGVGVFTLLN